MEILGGMHDIGGVLTSDTPRGDAGKIDVDLPTKWYMPEAEGSLYDIIKGRTAAAHDPGKVNTSRNLLRRETEEEDGPMIPRASEKFPAKF